MYSFLYRRFNVLGCSGLADFTLCLLLGAILEVESDIDHQLNRSFIQQELLQPNDFTGTNTESLVFVSTYSTEIDRTVHT
ncbi:hypothetical protein XELAEV_18002913mg [Xenopus laevis]|uniref:Uncharacterized protein n=1 Tax=Xenopus laevis TaxID=8355 RepID=A0A974BQ59_XENLA|nr:hypothetical protein XELAEV_18002913mg [Xenopus laevis]